jgi:hypothetical protein
MNVNITTTDFSSFPVDPLNSIRADSENTDSDLTGAEIHNQN